MAPTVDHTIHHPLLNSFKPFSVRFFVHANICLAPAFTFEVATHSTTWSLQRTLRCSQITQIDPSLTHSTKLFTIRSSLHCHLTIFWFTLINPCFAVSTTAWAAKGLCSTIITPHAVESSAYLRCHLIPVHILMDDHQSQLSWRLPAVSA